MSSSEEVSKHKSLHSLSSRMLNPHCDTIPLRLEFVKEILDNTNIEPIVNVDNQETEGFVGPLGSLAEYGYNVNDARYVLNKKIKDFYQIISQIGGTLRYIKSGTSGHTFKGIIAGENGERINYAVKVVAYKKKEKYGNINDIRRPENAELLMIRVLSYFVVNQETPHIVLPIGTFNTSINPFTNLIERKAVSKDNKKYKQFLRQYANGDLSNTVSILISEWANRGDFLDFVRQMYTKFRLIHWKVFFFQILSVLAVIQKKYPAFRHNDLKANNILVHKISNNQKKLHRYSICGKDYYVPSIGYILKIWDFDFACIPGIVDNGKVNAKWTSDLNIKPRQNRYYDMHYFFNTFIRHGFFDTFMLSDAIPQEAKDFVNRVVPLDNPNYQTGEHIAERGRILIDHEYIIPDKVLKTDPFFDEFRIGKKKKDEVALNQESSNKILNSVSSKQFRIYQPENQFHSEKRAIKGKRRLHKLVEIPSNESSDSSSSVKFKSGD